MNDFKIKDKYIDNGSYVLISKDAIPLNSQDAYLFLVDGAATLKRYKKDGSYVYLTPVSKDDFHKPIILSESDDVRVAGKVVDVFSF